MVKGPAYNGEVLKASIVGLHEVFALCGVSDFWELGRDSFWQRIVVSSLCIVTVWSCVHFVN